MHNGQNRGKISQNSSRNVLHSNYSERAARSRFFRLFFVPFRKCFCFMFIMNYYTFINKLKGSNFPLQIALLQRAVALWFWTVYFRPRQLCGFRWFYPHSATTWNAHFWSHLRLVTTPTPSHSPTSTSLIGSKWINFEINLQLKLYCRSFVLVCSVISKLSEALVLICSQRPFDKFTFVTCYICFL